MSKQFVAVCAAALLLVAASLLVNESPGGGSGKPLSAPQLVPVRSEALGPACPRHTPRQIPINAWPLARHVLAPPGASSIRLCRYSGLNDHPRLTLIRSTKITAGRVIRSLVREFDSLPEPRGTMACSLDDGSAIVALLAYPSGRAVAISVGLRGCELVTNGSVYRVAAAIGPVRAHPPTLVAQLERLTG
jgi:hypothetical protein